MFFSGLRVFSFTLYVVGNDLILFDFIYLFIFFLGGLLVDGKEFWAINLG